VALDALDGDLTAVGSCQALHDAEAQPAATFLASSGLLPAVEALEDMGEVRGGDARALIAHLDGGALAACAGAPRLRRAGRVLAGIDEQIADDRCQRVAVDPGKNAGLQLAVYTLRHAGDTLVKVMGHGGGEVDHLGSGGVLSVEPRQGE